MKRRASLKRKAQPPPKLPSSSSRSTMDDVDVEPRSLYVVVSYGALDQYFSSILQLEPRPESSSLSSRKTQVIPTEFSANFSVPSSKHSVQWAFSPLVTPTKAELCIVPDWCSIGCQRHTPPLPCAIFDLRTQTCTPIKPPHSPKFPAHVATLRDHIYLMANPQRHVDPSLPLFERYNTLQGSWEVLEPFPPYDTSPGPGHRGYVVATVVLDDTILLNIDGHKIWAYYVPKGQWYLVEVKNKRCYSMTGEAVALKNRIYAITTSNADKVLELSIERRKINGGLVFELNLQSEILVPGMKRIKFSVKLKEPSEWTEHFVHLGKDNFCLVQSCNFGIFSHYQYIQVTYIKLRGKDSTVTNRCVHKFKILEEFDVKCCFSLPKSKTTVLEGQRLFNVNLESRKPEAPKVGRFMRVACSSVRTKLYFGPKASTHGDGAERIDTDEEGCSTCERPFRADITLRQFVEELNKYEPEGFRLVIDNIGNLSAYVKFESEAQKRESYFSSDITLGRFVKKVRNYGPNEYRLMIDNTGNFCACLDFESASYKKHVAEWKYRTKSEYNYSDYSMSDVVDTDSDEGESFSESDYEESFEESDYEQLSEEETPAKESAEEVTTTDSDDSDVDTDSEDESFSESDSDELSEESDSDELSEESDSDELSEEETPAKVGKKRSSDSEPKIPAANKKMRGADGKNAGTSHVATHPSKETKKKRRKHGKVACRSVSTIVKVNPLLRWAKPFIGPPSKKRKRKLSLVPKASTHGDGAERNHTDEEGRSICVRNLPLDSNFGQLLEELKKFGPIKSNELKLVMNNTGNFSANVEYESATSKQHAIEASTIKIGGCQVLIQENRKAPSHSS